MGIHLISHLWDERIGELIQLGKQVLLVFRIHTWETYRGFLPFFTEQPEPGEAAGTGERHQRAIDGCIHFRAKNALQQHRHGTAQEKDRVYDDVHHHVA